VYRSVFLCATLLGSKMVAKKERGGIVGAVTHGSTSSPANIAEFNTIVGLVFAQLYDQFPSPIDRINREAIASAMGVPSSGLETHMLPSGRPFTRVLTHTVLWLSDEGYIRPRGSSPAEIVALTEKGLAALNAVPKGLSATIGSTLVKASSETRPNLSGIGDLIGGVIGGFTKTMTGS
jgi:hypothetical protein